MNNIPIPYRIHDDTDSSLLETGTTRSQVLELNDTAANFMDEGNVEPAYYILLEALDKLSNCILPPRQVEESSDGAGKSRLVFIDDSAGTEDHHDHLRGNEFPPDQEMQDVADDNSISSNDTQEEDDDFSVWEQEQVNQDPSCFPGFYPHPFSFHIDLRVPEQEMTKEQYNLCALSCLYNLGLCCHLQWDDARSKLKSQDISTLADKHLVQWLQRAAHFYQEAVLLLRTDPSLMVFLHKDRNGAPLIKVLLAACVNAIQIHSILANTRSLQTFQSILQRLVGLSSPETRRSRVFLALRACFDQENLSRAPVA